MTPEVAERSQELDSLLSPFCKMKLIKVIWLVLEALFVNLSSLSLSLFLFVTFCQPTVRDETTCRRGSTFEPQLSLELKGGVRSGTSGLFQGN
jgi:hypothetical protein